MRRQRKDQIERERLMAAGDFLGLEERLAQEPLNTVIIPGRILELQRATNVALQQDPGKAMLDLLLSMISHDVKLLFTLRGNLNSVFQTEAESGHVMVFDLPDRIRESHLLRLQRIEEHLLRLIDRYTTIKARMARIKKAEGGKVEPAPTLKIAPANQPVRADGAVAL